MYTENIKEIKQKIKTLHEYENVVSYLSDKLALLEKAQEDLRATIAEYQESSRPVELISSEATDILKKYAMQAIHSVVEFDLYQFRDRLMKAIEDPRVIKITWNPKTQNAKIDINLDISAGTLLDYSRSIERTRAQLKVGPYKRTGVYNPQMASYMWAEKYYKPAREGTDIPQPKDNRKNKDKEKKVRHYNVAKYINAYKRTIRTRLANFKKLAPFWRIINYGTQPLESDQDGVGYPLAFGPTYFVERAKKVISGKIAEEFRGTNSSIEEIRHKQEEMKRAERYCRQMLEAFTRRIAEIDEAPKTEQAFTMREIRKRLGDQFTEASMRDILTLVTGLIEGTIDPRKKRTIHLKSGGSTRRRVKQLYNDLQEYRNR